MKSTFQTILLFVFIGAFAFAVIAFSGLISFGTKKSATGPQGTVNVWGVLPKDLMNLYVSNFNTENHGFTISYTEHSPQNFTEDLIVALANGIQPDLLIYSSEIFSTFKDKLAVIPFASSSERVFRDTYIDGAQLFLTADGSIGTPVLVDPLVVYYNKDILARSNFVVPPKTWSSLQQAVPLFTRRDAKGTIIQSAIALGTSDNTDHARDILSTLFLQTGNPIVMYDPSTNSRVVTLSNTSNVSAEAPTVQALRFFTSFSNPTNTNYSWNNSLPSSRSVFLAGKSAFYIGKASELFTIQAQNPNLNFDVMEMFQTEGSARPTTYGSFIGISVVKKSLNPTAAVAAHDLLTNSERSDTLSKALSLPPVRRDLLLTQQQNPYVAVFFKAAFSTFSWADPNPKTTEKIFRDMIKNVTSGRSDAQTAIYDASRDLQSSIR